MIGSLAQGALLMGVVYWYSKCMFSMINDYYRDEFKRNVIPKTPERLPENSNQESDIIKKHIDETNEIKINILPTTPTMEGLPDILKENSILHNDDKIITRGSKEHLNCKLTKLEIRESLDCEEKVSLIKPDNNVDKFNTKTIKKFEKKQIKINHVINSNCNSDSEFSEDMVKKSYTVNYKRHQDLINFDKFNNDDHHQQDLNLPSTSLISSAIDLENEKIEKQLKNKLCTEYDDQVMDRNNNFDDIVNVDINKPTARTTTINPSTSTKLNYISNYRNHYVPSVINDANNWCKEIQCSDGGESIIDGKCNRKLPINQLHDKNKFNNNINMNIGSSSSSSCKININSNKPPLCKYKKNDAATGNCCISSDKIEKKIMTSNLDISTLTLQKKSINSHSINNNENSNLNEITNSKSYMNINKLQLNRGDNEMKLCHRKSVSEYIEFWSNMQP